MGLILLLLFIIVPLAEIALLIKIGEVVGVLPTIALVVATAVIGLALIRRQGLATLARAQKTLEAGGMPVDAALDGVCLLIAGAFLLTPGLITDTAGFLLLVPPLRRALARWGFAWLRRSGRVHMHVYGKSAETRRDGPPVIEGEYERIEPEPRKSNGDAPRRPSGWRTDR